jgi:hypothetical protein
MSFLELFDETLDINSTENYELSVQAGYDRLSFCILDSIRNKYILLRSFSPESNKNFTPGQIGELISMDDFLTKKYKRVNVVMPSQKYTLVPPALFDPGRKEDYFTFNHVSSEGEIILNNRLADPDTFLLYAESKPLYDLIRSFYPAVFPVHHLKPLFDQISRNRKSTGDLNIHLHAEADFFSLIIFKNQSLIFSNAFNFRNISDILYYTLNAFRNLGIGQEETIYLSGQIERYDDLYSNLSLYIRNVRFADPAGTFTFSYVFNDTDLHRYINLLSLINCE